MNVGFVSFAKVIFEDKTEEDDEQVFGLGYVLGLDVLVFYVQEYEPE